MNSKRKGSAGERELARILTKLLGVFCRRGRQFKGGADSPDVVGLKDIHIECKRVEKLNVVAAMKQAIRDCEGINIPTVMHRRNREEWLVTMRLTDWAELYRSWQHEKEG